MARRALVIAACGLSLLMGAGAVTAQPPARAEAETALDQYLERVGLDELLVRRLTDRIAQMPPGEERAEAVRLLAAAYARLLDESSDGDVRERWQAAATDLVRNAPDEATTELRLSLARVTYAQLEDTASRWLMAMAHESERQVALRRLTELGDELERLADRAQREVPVLEQRESNERRPGMARAWAERKAEAARHRSMAHYLAGWAGLHAADLEPFEERRARRATDALAHLGWLLNAPRDRSPELERLPEGTLVFEHVSRAAVASAAAFAHTGEIGLATRWFRALVDADEFNDAVVPVLRQRRAIALAHVGRWEDLASVALPDEQLGEPPLDVAEARLLAALSLDRPASQSLSPRDERSREFIRDRALSSLVAANELGHVLDLAQRFGLDRLGGNTFVAHQVKALRLYQQARDQHEAAGDADRPTTDLRIAAAYEQAATQFSAALAAPDAASFADSLGSAVMLLGLSQYYAGLALSAPGAANADQGLRAAADAFEQAARDLRDQDRAAAALWMAIHALDQVLEQGLAEDEEAIVARRDRIESRFLAAYPDHPQAAAITIRRAEGQRTLGLEERIEMLRSIDPTSKMRNSADRQAARLAYDAWREAATPADRDWTGARYLAMAEPLLAEDRRAARDNQTAAQRAVLRARRMAEVALALNAPDLARAQAALDVADALIAEGLTGAALADELAYRRAQLALARHDTDAAQQIVDDLRAADPRYATAAQRLFFQHAQRQWSDRRPAQRPAPTSLTPDQVESARQLARAGRSFLTHLKQDDSASTVEALRVRRAVVEALCALHFATDDDAAGAQALLMNATILEAQPHDAVALRSAAELNESAGTIEPALEAWRVLLTGLPPRDPDWFEAKYRLVRLLAAYDPLRARKVMDQHRVLHPSFGPEPWGPLLRELDATIPKPVAEDAAS